MFLNNVEEKSILGAILFSQDMALNVIDYNMDTLKSRDPQIIALSVAIWDYFQANRNFPDYVSLMDFIRDQNKYNALTPLFVVECINLWDVWLKRIVKQKFGKKPYRYYLKSAHWQRIRKRALIIDSKCALCNSDKNIQIHHRTYEHFGYEMMEDLTVLCADCHHIFHMMKRLDETA
ncbi:MAG: HNH endonuclease [Chloroflexi bacterium]|nr:HNH endonuclease [Chloroflexota bacterium]